MGLAGYLGIVVLATQPPTSSPVAGLVRLYQSGRVPREREAAIVEMICQRGDANDLRVVLERVVQREGMDGQLRRNALQWLIEAAVTRQQKPSGELDGILALLEEEDLQIRVAALRLAAAWRLPKTESVLTKLLGDAGTPLALRQAALQEVVAVLGPKSRQVLVDLIRSTGDTSLRVAAVATLAAVDLPEAAHWAAAVLQQADAQQDIRPLLAAFLDRRDGSQRLAEALAGTELSPDVAKRALRMMFSLGRNDAELSAVLSQAAGLQVDVPPPTPEQVATISRDVLERGDPARGEMVFRSEDVNCFRCHSLNRAGGQVGPDLSAIGGSSPLDYIVNSILNPNLAIKEQYLTRVFLTADGRVLTGIVLDRDESRVRLRNAQGEVVTILTRDIEEETEGPSMMPTGLTKFLTYQETIDLIRFVSELGKPGPYAPTDRHYAYRYQHLTSCPPELLSEVPHLELMRQWVFTAPPEAWKVHYAKFDGFLPLAELRAGSHLPAVLLRAEFQVQHSGDVVWNIECTEPFQTWLDEQPVTLQSGQTMRVEEGKHSVLFWIKLPSDTEPSLRVELQRPAQNSAAFEWVGTQ